MAEAGIATLRFDFAGLGDSGAIPSNGKSFTYSTPRENDFRAAIAWLRSQGYTRFDIVGHCSGAYHAFKYAHEDEVIDNLYLINMLVFSWEGEGSVEFATASHTRGWAYYRRKIFDWRSWGRLIAQGNCVQQLLQIALDVWTKILDRLQTRGGSARTRLTADAYPYNLIERLTRRGTRIAFLVGERDESASELELYYGPGGKEAARHEGVVVAAIPDADHSLTTLKARRAVIGEIVRLAAARSAQDAWTRSGPTKGHPDHGSASPFAGRLLLGGS